MSSIRFQSKFLRILAKTLGGRTYFTDPALTKFSNEVQYAYGGSLDTGPLGPRHGPSIPVTIGDIQDRLSGNCDNESVDLLDDDEYVMLLHDLGVDVRAQRREHRSASRRIVSEIYSPPRVTRLISSLPSVKLLPGFALDLTCIDPDDNQPWDFDKQEKREKARALLREQKPLVLIGSPMCTAYCTWQRINSLRRDPHVVQRELDKARMHLEFVVGLYNEQLEQGRFFLHEHPQYAGSWYEECVRALLDHPGVERVEADQCQYGAEVTQGIFQGCPVKKATGFMSNGSLILEELRRRCSGRDGDCSRRRGGTHAHCQGRIAKDAARYPVGLCRAIIRGITRQLDMSGITSVGEVGLQGATDDAADARAMKVQSTGYSGKFKDDITGQPLRDDLVREARAKELQYFTSKGVWRKRPRQEAFARTGHPPISVRWVDVNKGDDLNPRYRSRLVARQLKAKDKSGQSFFAPTPPLEALRTVLSFAATTVGTWRPCYESRSGKRMQILCMDISRAYFNAKIDDDRPTYVQLPAEDKDAGVLCGELLRHMYGTRAAADGWQEEYSVTLVSALGFVQGLACPCVFRHPEREVVVSVHGDDFTAAGSKNELDWFEASMNEHYELTAQPRIGPGEQDAKEGIVLNRIIRWTPEGIQYEADPRQAEKLIAECGLEGSNSVATPGIRAAFSEVEQDEPLRPELHTAFRGSAARANYLAMDRIDCQFASKEICRLMAKPTVQSWNALKRLCRYLVGLPRLVYTYKWQEVKAIDIYTDTDWAGCPRTRKSTSGGCVLLGAHAIKTWSSTQSSVALSSGEAEFNGVVKGAGIGLGYQSLLRDLGQDIPVRVWTDSSASIGICSRQGLGKLRHLDTHTLWIQQAVRSGRIDLRKVLGDANPADLFTKHSLSRDRLMKLTRLYDCRFLDGRAASAPQRREGKSGKTTMAGACLVNGDLDDDLIVPHLMFSDEELEKRYPKLVAHDEEDTGDLLKDDDDILLREGMRIVGDFVEACSTRGRRRRPETLRTAPHF